MRFAAIVGSVLTAIALSSAWGAALASVPLPDGRAWEMVSPLEKNGGEINGIDGVVPNNGLPEGGIVQTAEDGSAITYVSLIAFPDSEGHGPKGAPVGSQYLSARGSAGWSAEDITTVVNSKSYPAAGAGAPYRAFSTDLSSALLLNGIPPVENPFFPEKAPLRYQNYYLRDDTSHLPDDASGKFEPLLTATPEEAPSAFSLDLRGVTPDLRHIVVGTTAALTDEATRQTRGNLYEWMNGQLYPVNVLPLAEHPTHPEETAPGGALLGMGEDELHTISEDGSRVVWRQPETGTLFMRTGIGTSHAETVEVDASKIPGPGGLGVFKAASADGSDVFFTDRRRLTPDSTSGEEVSQQDLYLFEVESGRLTDLTVDPEDVGGASVQGVLESSPDGSYVYFVAKGRLTEEALAGRNNLYVWHKEGLGKGSIRFIAILSGEDEGIGANHDPLVADDWPPSTGQRTARVTADGRHLVFMSNAQLTGYDNRDAATGVPDQEVYMYDFESDSLTCLSCNPDGRRPDGSSGIPGGTPWQTVNELGTYQSRVLSADAGRVFFDSRDSLVPQDTNGAQDVYEWERGGVGTCRLQAGCLFPLTGASNGDSAFVDASTSGGDVFFVTRAELVNQDTDQLRDLYDARVGGGLSSPVASIPCRGEDCLPSTSSLLTPASLSSATFAGAGNLMATSSKPAAKAKAKKTLKRPKRAKKRKVKKKARKAGRAKLPRSHGGGR